MQLLLIASSWDFRFEVNIIAGPDIESYGYEVRKLNSSDSSGGSGNNPLDWSLLIEDVPCRPQIQAMLAPCSEAAGPRTKV